MKIFPRNNWNSERRLKKKPTTSLYLSQVVMLISAFLILVLAIPNYVHCHGIKRANLRRNDINASLASIYHFDVATLRKRAVTINPTSCEDTCKGHIEVVVDDEYIRDASNYAANVRRSPITCWNTDKVTNTKALIGSNFVADISCWNVSGVTDMSVSSSLIKHLSYQCISFTYALSLFDTLHIFTHVISRVCFLGRSSLTVIFQVGTCLR